jgi:tripartite-type tricarboxylate transporter receptor subunit TctC
MALSRSRFLSCLMAGAAVLALPLAHAQAQSYPDRPIKLVVPFAPGGATDILGRLLATSLGERLGQPVVVENRPGAGTVVAGALVAKAPPDGYTLLLGASTTLTLNPVIRNPLPYDPLRSFTPLGLVADMGLVLVAHNETPARTLPELVALAKADPDKLSYGSFGTGSSVHFGGEMLKTATGMRMVHVPFNGSSPISAVRLGELPLKGTCTMRIPVAVLSISPPKCTEDPVPKEP